eukprot:TRINITY_DN17098_c0_g1_i1.p1 TRINITY_DN17098_c0_g1~~TRINITY_DN17098_c0_g1_i1.p1  ORF type:complete len:446 (+),score=81.19 TRINITY_DN17098_c0_g1_i1:42-1340(+)
MSEKKEQISVIVVGAGNRGKVYSTYALDSPFQCKVVGVAEPLEVRREWLRRTHNVAEERSFACWKEAAALPKFADAVIITTQDRQHAEPAIAFANLGYHILLEKPMAVDENECVAIAEAVKRNNVILATGHVMRYSPYSLEMKRLVESGVIGKVAHISHLEPVGWFHYAHSYVRGNWRREDQSSSCLMAKSCHDIDWLRWIVGASYEKISSFGSLSHFRPENKPEGGGSRCLECKVEATCPYSAKRIYLDSYDKGNTAFPVANIVDYDFAAPTATMVGGTKAVTDALTNGPYGRCVYECDNDVVDNQVVNIAFQGGVTASFSMVAFTEEVCQRQTRIHGTRGQLVGDGKTIRHFDFTTTISEDITPPQQPSSSRMSGHGGADFYLMRSFVESVQCGDASKITSGVDEALESHLMVFAAERARKNDTVERNPN